MYTVLIFDASPETTAAMVAALEGNCVLTCKANVTEFRGDQCVPVRPDLSRYRFGQGPIDQVYREDTP